MHVKETPSLLSDCIIVRVLRAISLYMWDIMIMVRYCMIFRLGSVLRMHLPSANCSYYSARALA